MTETVRLLRDVALPLPDGTTTRAEIWLGGDDRPRPAVLVRTPYGKELAAPLPVTDARQAVRRGYALVVQDVRGRGASEGAFEPFVSEEADGVASVDWVAAQPWCDGRVVMSGMSYVGATQWLAAAGRPSALRAINPTLTADDFAEGWSFQDGVAEHGFLATWNAANLAAPADLWLDAPERAWDDADGVAAIAPWSRAWSNEPPGSAYWRARSVAHRRDEVAVPALVVAGWYDTFLTGSLRSFARSTHPSDRLMVGPWGHDPLLSHLVGDANLGAAGNGLEQFYGWVLDFFDDVLAGRPPTLPRAWIYVLGAGQWIGLGAWPPEPRRDHEVALAAAALPVDPTDPVPSAGGRGLLVGVPGWGFGVRDQRAIAERDDVVVGCRERVTEALLLAGPVSADLSVSPPGRDDALWVVTLCVQRPDGVLRNLAEGVAASRGDDGRVTVALGDVCCLLEPGDVVVALVAGSSFPRWPRPAAAAVQEVLAGSVLRFSSAPLSLLDASARARA